MLPSLIGSRPKRKNTSKKCPRLYKPKIEYTDDGFVVTTLYIRSLGKEITRNHLLDYFAKFGNVQNVRIHTKPNCFGFVTFARAESASKALQCRSHKINGRDVSVAIADSWHQEKPLELSNNHKAKPVKLPIELTNTTGTYLLDLNDDCLYEIFSLELLTIMDLCSVAETCTRFKAIAARIFSASYKSCKFNEMPLKTIHEMRRMLINFGSSITDLTIGPSFDFERKFDGMSSRVLDLVIRYCHKTLLSLRLEEYDISDLLVNKLRPMFGKLQLLHINEGSIGGDGKQLLAGCRSLVELRIVNSENDSGMIFENTFPKLERFQCQKDYDGDYEDYDLEAFVSHHKGLKELSLGGFADDYSSLLPVIANNCTDLEELQISGGSRDSPWNYMTALKSLLALKKLKKLKIKCGKEKVTEFVQELSQLSELEFLELHHVESDEGFIPALSQLKNLKVLRLRCCDHLTNVNSLADLEKLTELSLLLLGSTKTDSIEIDPVGLVKRLNNLEKLTVGFETFKVDRQMYLQLVNAVRERSGRSPSSLEVKALSIEHSVIDLQLDGKNKAFVKLVNLHRYDSEYGSEEPSYIDDDDSDYDYDPYFLDDDDDEDDENDDFPFAFLMPFMQQQLMNRFPGYGAEDTDDEDADDNDDAEMEVW